MRKQAIFRIRIFAGIVLVIALILVGRLYQLQVLQHAQYVAKGEQQYVHTVRDLYSRGSIFFTTKDNEYVSAATIQGGFVLALDPSNITDAEGMYTALEPYVTIDRDLFITRATLANRTYVEIDTRLNNENAEAIDALDLSGVQLYRNQWRYYPATSLAARTVGFTGFSGESAGEQSTGRYGLERYYEETLARDNERLSVNFFAEIFSNLGGIVFDTTESRQGDVVTTIEPTVSRMLQQQLQITNDTWNSRLTGGIVMNPHTGEIFALDAVPTFDVNDRSGATIEEFRNPLVEDVYEFGSIIKALTMAAGLDSGAVTRGTTYYDSGKLELDTFTIGNFDGKGRGYVDMQEVLNQSLNTGVAFIVDTMGKDAFREYFKNLKLGSESGIDLPNEAQGLTNNLDSPRDIEYATASFGQGIAMTPISATRALATLANGGVLVTPHIASKIEYDDGTEKVIQYPDGQQIFSTETSEEISRMLTTVVDDALRGGEVALDDYTVAAKTGTAQIADADNGGYYEDKFLHSFFGYFPAYDPEFIVFLYTVEPKEVRYASETLTEPFMELTKFLINYYDIPPDR